MKRSFLLYDSYAAIFRMLPDDLAGQLIKAIFAYREDGSMSVKDPALKAVLAMVIGRMADDDAAYAETCDRNRKAVEARWARRKESESIQANTDVYERIQGDTKHTDSDSDSDLNKKKESKKERFVAPTVEEVRAYVREKGYTFDPEAFVAYYKSNGWRVGRGPMKDWRSACVTWQKREKKPAKQNWNVEQHEYDFDDLERRLMG